MKQKKKDTRKFRMGELKERLINLDTKNLYPIIAANILGASLDTIYNLSYRYNVNFAKTPWGFNKMFKQQLAEQKAENERFNSRMRELELNKMRIARDVSNS